MSETRKFTYEEALLMMPQVESLTATAVARLEAISGSAFRWDEELEIPPGHAEEYESLVLEWAGAIESLGIVVKGLWLIDFDNGSGYYCWRWPESGLKFFHGYEEGFRGRVELN